MDRLRKVWPILVLIIAPLMVVGKAVFSPHGIGDFDQIHAMAPWFGPEPAQPWDILQADSVLQFYGWRKLVFESWGSGVPPYWNPYVLMGTPLLANSQSGGFYPPHILVGFLRLPTETGIDLLAWFHLAIAGLGTWRLVRTLGGANVGGVVAGLSFQLCPFLISWTSLASVVSTVAWIPWLVAGTVTCFSFDLQTNVKRLWSSVSGIALSGAMVILAGHLQFAFYGFLAAGVACLAMFAKHIRSNGVKGSLLAPIFVLGGFVLAACLAAPQLFPVLEYSKFSHRRNTPSEEGYKAYVGLALKPYEFATRLATPFPQGNPTKPIEVAEMGIVAPGYMTAIARPGANYAESAATIGPLAVGLILFGFLDSKKRKWALGGVGLALFFALFAIGTDLNRLLYFLVPGWSSTGSPGRIIVLALLTLAVTAGMCVPETPSIIQKRKGLIVSAALLVIVLAAQVLGFSGEEQAAMNLTPSMPDIVSAAHSIDLLSAMIGAMIAAVGLLAAAFSVKHRAVALSAAAVGCVGLTGLPNLIRIGDPTFLHSKPILFPEGRVAVINERWSFVGRPNALMPPNTGVAAGVHDIGGYDSLLHRDTVAILHRVNGKDPAPEANGNMMFTKPEVNRMGLRNLGCAGIVHGPAETGGQWTVEPIPADRGRIVVRPLETYRGRTIVFNAAEFVRETRCSIEINVLKPGRIELRDRNMPGWTALLNGRPVPIEDGEFRTVLCEEPGTLVMTYTPPGLSDGVKTAILGVVASVLLAFIHLQVVSPKEKPAENSA